jgi:hypothetical protein
MERYREKYRLVATPKDEEKIAENEVRITQQGQARSYIGYATSLLQVSPPLVIPSGRTLCLSQETRC